MITEIIDWAITNTNVYQKNDNLIVGQIGDKSYRIFIKDNWASVNSEGWSNAIVCKTFEEFQAAINKKRLPLTVTKHARERYIVRITDPKRYQHLTQCRIGCEICVNLDKEIFSIVRAHRNNIDRSISRLVLLAIEKGQIEDSDFIEAVKKADSFSKEAEYYQDEKNGAIYVIVREPSELILVTILTLDMLEGSVLMFNDKKEILNKWKFQARNTDKEVKNLNSTLFGKRK